MLYPRPTTFFFVFGAPKKISDQTDIILYAISLPIQIFIVDVWNVCYARPETKTPFRLDSFGLWIPVIHLWNMWNYLIFYFFLCMYI